MGIYHKDMALLKQKLQVGNLSKNWATFIRTSGHTGRDSCSRVCGFHFSHIFVV